MAMSLFWVGFPYLLIGFTHSYPMLLVCVALVGFGNSLWHPTAIPTLGQPLSRAQGPGAVAARHGRQRRRCASRRSWSAPRSPFFSWRAGRGDQRRCPGLIVALLMFALLGTIRLGAKKAARRSAVARATTCGACAQLLRNRALVLLSPGSAFRTMTQTALLTFLPVYLAHDMGYSPLWVGACLFALQAAGFAAAPVAGHLSDRMGRKQIMMGSMADDRRGARRHGVRRQARRSSSRSSRCSASSSTRRAR